MYDVIVIGAGPAGLMAARRTAEKGAHVLVLEKDGKLGLKPCAEGSDASIFGIAGISFDNSLVSNAITSASVFPPDEGKGIKIFGNYKGYIINKSTFLGAMACKAVEAGASLQLQSEVEKIDVAKNTLYYKRKGEHKEAAFDYIVGADGTDSIVSRTYGFDNGDYSVLSAMQYTMVNCRIPERDMIRIYLGNKVAPSGYLWIFPKNEYLTHVGLGASTNAKLYLDKFIESHTDFFGSASIVAEGGGLIPVGGQTKEIVKGNAILCGDSAGQVIPITGEGIRPALAAGSMAGEAIIQAMSADDLAKLQNYPAEFNKHWGSMISGSLKFSRIIRKLSDNDLSNLAGSITGEDIVNLANGINVNKIIAAVLRHPILAMKLASKLV